MATEKIKLGGTTIKQPDENIGYNFETTYRSDSQRSRSGVMYAQPLFTVEQLSLSWSNLTVSEMSEILRIVAKGGAITVHYWSPYYGTWRDGTFRVAKGSLSIGCLDETCQFYESLSLNLTGDDPI